MKLYLKAAANPFVIVFSLLMMIGMSLVFAIDPDPVGSEDYMTMLACIQMGKIGVFLIAMIGNLKLHQNKFYASCCCAKALYTAAPIVTGLTISLPYDIILAITAAVNLGSAGLADVLINDSAGSALLVFIAACFGKKGLSWGAYIPYMLFMSISIIGKSGVLAGLLGKPVGLSAAIAVSVYVVSVVLSIVIVNVWWKKSDKFTLPNKPVMNAIGEQ